METNKTEAITDATNTKASGWKSTENRKKVVKEIEELLIKQGPPSQTQNISERMESIERSEEKVFASAQDEAEYIKKITAVKKEALLQSVESNVLLSNASDPDATDIEASGWKSTEHCKKTEKEIEELLIKQGPPSQTQGISERMKSIERSEEKAEYIEKISAMKSNLLLSNTSGSGAEREANTELQEQDYQKFHTSSVHDDVVLETHKYFMLMSGIPIDVPKMNVQDNMQDKLCRHVLAIVLRNPGISEEAILGKMNNVWKSDSQSLRTLLDSMVRDKHLDVKKTYKDPFAAVPSLLRNIVERNDNQSAKRICKEHFFANPKSSLL